MEKISDDAIRQSIESTLIETFEAMMSARLEVVPSETGGSLDGRRVVGTVHFGGEVLAVMNLQLSEALARALTAAARDMDVEEIQSTDQIIDAIGEVAAIAAGNLKTEFLDSGLACVIATPSITMGSDFTIDPAAIGPPIQITFRHQDDYVQVDVCAKENPGTPDDVDSDRSSTAIADRIAGVDIKKAVVDAVIEVFDTLLEMKVTPLDQQPAAFSEQRRTAGSLALAGQVDGLLMVQVNDDFGKQMAAAMLGSAVDEIESAEEVYDVVREVSSMIGGRLKSRFADAGLACRLSPPTITNGVDFWVSPTHAITPTRLLFAHQESVIVVEAGVRDDSPVPAVADKRPAPPAQTTAVEQPAGNAVDSHVDRLKNLGLIMDIPLEVTVELGRSRKRINDLLKLRPGSVIELSQMEGEPVDILVNQTLIAKGVVVVEKEKYGIRISEIVSRQERLKSFR
jgi:flagellar motor switch protein FliN